MFRTVRSRAIVILGLVALLFGLTVWYGSLGPAPALGAYPDQADLATDAERYLGDRVTVDGHVIDTTPVTISADYGRGKTLRVTVTDLAITPQAGEQLRVFGVVEGERTVRAIDAFTVPQSGHWYAWGISFLAGVWVLTRLVRHWRLDRADWTLSPRATSATPSLGARLRTTLHQLRNH